MSWEALLIAGDTSGDCEGWYRKSIPAARLRELRAEHEVTQVELARELRVSQNRVSQIERGDVDKAQIDTLRKYVEALGGTLTVEAIFGDSRYVIA